ncbi:hypothetical protein HPS174_0624 [Glaesserella parasuis 174]|uniref:Uncharacterized protein n=1 Tax=Glaesserella parasuis serovar 5 (strain SH0165) TaxID=557723 RepID=B8F5I0_GLAP5|nr:hypothetical protein HAPS_0955 [Glaesserella parasuis SH0165]EQA14152.1 hypothetical protein HPS174_0624 [Glaesserella parasuis 174]EQA95432.1 hypothetical protein HPS_0889 [Glaesserella parasuis 29755]
MSIFFKSELKALYYKALAHFLPTLSTMQNILSKSPLSLDFRLLFLAFIDKS